MALTKVTGQVIKNTTDVTVGVLTVTNTLAVGGTVSIGGTLTYEDVTNVDAVGLITARNGIVVGSGITLSKDGDVFFTGIATGNGSGLTALNASNLGSGTVPTARLGSGTASSSTFLRGDSTFAAVTSTTINSNADNRIITGSGTANTLNGESTLTYDSGGMAITGDSDRDGYKITQSGNNYGEFMFNSNRSSANSALGIIRSEWNSTEVASIYLSSGSDTTNKDDGEIKFYTSPDSGTGITERLRIHSNGTVEVKNTGNVKIYADSSGGYIQQDVSNLDDLHLISSGKIKYQSDPENDTVQTAHIFECDGSEKLRIASDGKVGINEAAPSEALQIDGDILLGGEANSGTSDYAIKFEYNNHQFAKIVGDGRDSTGYGDIDFYTSSGSGVSNLTQRMTIRADGKIGINRSDPDRTLCVSGVIEINSYDNTSGGGSYYTSKGFMIGNAYDAGKSSSVTDDRNAIVWNERGLDVDFATSDTLRMKIDYNGNVFFNGMTNLTASSTNKGVVMEESAQNGRINIHATSSAGTAPGVLFYHSGNNVGAINYTSSAVSYGSGSDYRLKENITAISDGITRLKTLKPSRFNFKVDKDKTVDGFIAHEVSSIVPEAIIGTKDEVDSDNNPVYQQIDQAKLVPLLTAALQEAIAKIETLETKVAALEG